MENKQVNKNKVANANKDGKGGSDVGFTAPQKKKWYRTKKFYAAVAAVVLLSLIGYGQFKKGTAQPDYETVFVQKGELIQTVDATGNVESADELDLRFESSGRIGKLYFESGDDVTAGQVIAQLDLSGLNAAVSQASANVQKAQADLNKTLAGNTDDYIASMAARLEKAQADLDQVRASYADAVSDAEADLLTAENNLRLAEGGDDSQIVNEAYDDMVALLQQVQNTLAEALSEADNILGVDNKYANDDYEGGLSIMDESRLNVAKINYSAAKSAKIDSDELINNLTTVSSHEQVDWAADTTAEALTSMKSLLFSVTAVLDASRPVGGLTQTTIDTLKTNIQTDRASVTTDYASVLNQQQAINDAGNSYYSYQIAYDKALSSLENLQDKAAAELSAYEALVNQARANWLDAKNPPREVDVAGYRAALSAARAGLSQAVANRDKAKIVAPLDGVIGKIEGKEGEYVSSQDIVVKLVSPHFEVKVDIPETDIIKISQGDKASIKLDAYGEDIEFVGMVTEIEVGETIIQDVVYYTVTLSLEQNNSHEILNGMTADVLFYTEQKDGVLFVPQRTVRTNEKGKYVRILENEEIVEKTVVTGLRGDGGVVEIISGLTEGQEVVVSTNGS